MSGITIITKLDDNNPLLVTRIEGTYKGKIHLAESNNSSICHHAGFGDPRAFTNNVELVTCRHCLKKMLVY